MANALGELLQWPVVHSGDIARRIDQNTRQTGAMADGDALDAALLPLVKRRPVILDGYPRTQWQLATLRDLPGWAVVGLNIDPDVALRRLSGRGRADDALYGAERVRSQNWGLVPVWARLDLVVNVNVKTTGEVVFEILTRLVPEMAGHSVGRSGMLR